MILIGIVDSEYSIMLDNAVHIENYVNMQFIIYLNCFFLYQN